MTSTERVRAFRERNPGYDARRMRAYRAMMESHTPVQMAEIKAIVAEAEPVAVPAEVIPDIFAEIRALQAARAAELLPVLRDATT